MAETRFIKLTDLERWKSVWVNPAYIREFSSSGDGTMLVWGNELHARGNHLLVKEPVYLVIVMLHEAGFLTHSPEGKKESNG